MPPADKRARKKENARAAREQREAALRRRKRIRSATTVGIVVALFVGLIVLLNATSKKSKSKSTTTTTLQAGTTPSTVAPPTTLVVSAAKLDPTKTYTATMTTNFGTIKILLDAKQAPIGASRFADLARAGVYNDSRWHRVIKDFVIQGGAPGGDPTKSVGHSVVGELPTGKYQLGDLAAAKTQNDPNGTFDSQFFIITGSQGEALPAQYADFGHVTSGMDVVRKIEALPTDANQDPTQKATIDTVTIAES